VPDGTCAVGAGGRRRGVAHLDPVAFNEVLLDVAADEDNEVEEAGAVFVGVVASRLHDGLELGDLFTEFDHWGPFSLEGTEVFLVLTFVIDLFYFRFS